jgi:hypothetical protein
VQYDPTLSMPAKRRSSFPWWGWVLGVCLFGLTGWLMYQSHQLAHQEPTALHAPDGTVIGGKPLARDTAGTAKVNGPHVTIDWSYFDSDSAWGFMRNDGSAPIFGVRIASGHHELKTSNGFVTGTKAVTDAGQWCAEVDRKTLETTAPGGATVDLAPGQSRQFRLPGARAVLPIDLTVYDSSGQAVPVEQVAPPAH